MAGLLKRSQAPSSFRKVLSLGMIIILTEAAIAQTIITTELTSSTLETQEELTTPIGSTNGVPSSTMSSRSTTQTTTPLDGTTLNGTPQKESSSTDVPTSDSKRIETSTPSDVAPESFATDRTGDTIQGGGNSLEADGSVTFAAVSSTKKSEDVSPMNKKESSSQRIGGMAVGGLCLVAIILLLIAVNGYVIFKWKMGSCPSRRGVFKLVPMPSFKKNNGENQSDVEATYIAKGGDGDNSKKENGEVHVKVDVSAISESSKNVNSDDDQSPTKEDGKAADDDDETKQANGEIQVKVDIEDNAEESSTRVGNSDVGEAATTDAAATAGYNTDDVTIESSSKSEENVEQKD